MYVPSIRTIIWVLRCPISLPIVFSVLYLTRTSGANGLKGALPQQPDFNRLTFTKAEIRDGYNASSDFDARGMGGLYLITDILLDGIQPKSKKLPNETLEYLKRPLAHYQELLLYHIGIIILVAVGLILALIIPCIGLVCCCCRCAGKCGGKEDPVEKRRDRYRRKSLTVTLTFLTLLMTFGFICAFVTNEYMDQGLRQLSTQVKSHTNDIDLYINNTHLEVKQLFIENFNRFQNHINTSFNELGQRVQIEFEILIYPLVLDDVEEFFRVLRSLPIDLDKIANSSDKIRTAATKLKEDLRALKADLNSTIKNCNENSACNTFQLDPDLLNMPEFELPNLKSENFTTATNSTQQWIEKFKSIGKNMQNKIVDNKAAKLKKKLNDYGQTLIKQEKQVSDFLNGLNVKSLIIKEVDIIRPYIEEYSTYRWYGGVTISCIVFLIVLSYIIGLLFGICGKRPGDIYGTDTCNKGVGATFLLIANGLVTFFYFYLMLLITTFFLVGALVYVHVCRPFHDPVNSQHLKIADFYLNKLNLNINNTDVDISIGKILERCNENKSLYTVADLNSVIDLSQFDFNHWERELKINDTIRAIKDNFSDFSITLIDDEMSSHFDKVIQSKSLTANLSDLASKLNQTVTKNKLNNLKSKVNDLASDNTLSEVNRGQLKNLTTRLDSIYNQSFMVLDLEINNIKKTMDDLHSKLTIKGLNITDVAKSLKANFQNAEKNLNENGSKNLSALMIEVIEHQLGALQDYLTLCSNEINEEIGKCEPVSNVINSTLIEICKAILAPFNGFWISIGYILILFIPSMFIAYALVNLYRKTDSYPGIVVEAVDKRTFPEPQGIVNPNTMYDYSSESQSWMDDYNDNEAQKRLSRCLLSQPPPLRNDFREWGYKNGHGSHVNGHPVGSRGYEVYPMDATRPPAYLYPGPTVRNNM